LARNRSTSVSLLELARDLLPAEDGDARDVVRGQLLVIEGVVDLRRPLSPLPRELHEDERDEEEEQPERERLGETPETTGLL
jgi:hypothetical protein